jgi:ribosomal protein S19
MSRSVWKGGFVKQIKKNNIDNNNIIWRKRNELITPYDVGKSYFVENGKINNGNIINTLKIKPLTILIDHIGHKFGEFYLTKIPALYKRSSKRK